MTFGPVKKRKAMARAFSSHQRMNQEREKSFVKSPKRNHRNNMQRRGPPLPKQTILKTKSGAIFVAPLFIPDASKFRSWMGSAHELLWNFLPRGLARKFRAQQSLRSSIRAAPKIVK